MLARSLISAHDSPESKFRRTIMPIYVAMLRGINVAGKRIVKMEALRKSMESLGFGYVQTYVQSGNLVFRTEERSLPSVSRKIEERLETDFGFSIPVCLKALKDLEKVIVANPFLQEAGIEPSALHVTFLSELPSKAALPRLEAVAAAAAPDRMFAEGMQIYLHCPDGYGRTKLSNNVIESKLSVGATTRNWKTVNTLLAMAQQAE